MSRVTGSLAALVRLAAPIVIIQVGLMLMGVVDTLMLGRVSPQALAAGALGNLYFFGPAIFGIGVLMALDPVVAQAVGAGDELAVARGVQRGLLLTVGLTAVVWAAMLPAEWFFRLLKQPEDVVPLATGYVIRMIPGILPFLVFTVLRQTLQAMHRTWAIVATIVLANGANVLLNWVLIFGHWGFEPGGVIGSAWATTISRWLLALGVLALDWRQLRPHLYPFRPEAAAAVPLGRMFTLGLPIGIQMLLEFSAFGAIALLMGWLGTVPMAGHQVAINLASLTFMVPLGIGAAAAVLVGNAIGQGDARAAGRAARTALVCSLLFMSTTAVVFLLIPGGLARLYSVDPRVVAVAASLIPIAGVFQVFDGTQAVGAGILRGMGDTRAPMLINILGFWLVGLPVSVGLGFWLDLGPVGLWWGFVAGLGAVALLLLWRIRTRLRSGLRRVVIDTALAADEAW